MTDRPKRRAPTLAVKVAACERRLCELLETDRIEYNHEPALVFRAVNDAGTDYVPAQNDPRYIEALSREEHDRHTNGGKATTLGSVKHGAAKIDRITGKTKNGPKRKMPKRANAWPPKGSRKLPSQPMQRKAK